jgi:hypothetical protein
MEPARRTARGWLRLSILQEKNYLDLPTFAVLTPCP